MYRNRKFNRNTKSKENQPTLNVINEDSTIKLSQNRNRAQNDVEEMDVLSSEENIPASQEPTQRYLSQRSAITATTLGRTQSRLTSTSQRPPNTYFELALTKAGAQLTDDENFVLTCDHITFVNRLRELFNKNQNFQDHLEMFKNGLQAAWPKMAVKLLSGCTIHIPGDDNTYQSQDNMITNFFTIEYLREIVLDLLLGKIEECAQHSNQAEIFRQNGVPLLPLMLAQLYNVSASHSDIIFERIKVILEKSSELNRWHIISNTGFILDNSKHDEFAQLMMDILTNSKELFQPAGIETLNNLSLSARMQAKLRCQILAFIKEDQCPHEIIPKLVKLLMKILGEENENSIKELVNTLREILIWREKHTSLSSAKDKQAQLELFSNIEKSLIRSKKFYTIWLKTIASLTAAQIKSIDFVVLLLLMDVREDNTLYIENILKHHSKTMPIAIILEIRDKYTPILEHHWNTLMEVLNCFLRDKNKTTVEFAQSACRYLFEISGSVQKSILRKLLELTCERSSQTTVNFALKTLRDLWRLYPKILHNWGTILLPFLDHIHEMSLAQTRIIMELLSSVAYPIPTLDECDTLQDQLDILVKKQLINRNSLVKKQGIIATVQLIDCIARIEETAMTSDDFETSFNTADDLPDGRGKIAANYLMRTQTSTMYSPELMALFYDELAIVCCAKKSDRANSLFLDKNFVMWVCDLMTCYFQNSFVVEQDPEKIDGINLCYMKCINDTTTNSEQSELPKLAINIGELVLKPRNEASSSILVLPPLFNLVRVLQMQRYEGSLDLINALLGCAIILPDFFDDPDLDSIFNDYDEQLQKKILDIYFHCVNWMRETVSSFATQRDAMIRTKVLQRLVEIMKIENKIHEMLVKAPMDYTPPQCQFTYSSKGTNLNTKKKGKGRPPELANIADNATKAKKPRANQKQSETALPNETIANDTLRIATKSVSKSKISTKYNFENLYGPKEIYRQLDTNILLILKEKVNLTHPLPAEIVGAEIGLLELRFVLSDIVSKLESVVGIQKFQTETHLQYIAHPDYFVCDLSHFIRIIDENMKMISVVLNSKLDQVQHIYSHADLFTEELNLLKICFSLSLRLLVAYFSWPQWFANEHHINKLKKSLLVFMDESKAQHLFGESVAVLAAEAFDYLTAYENCVIDLKSAVNLYHLMLLLSALSDKEAKEKQAQDMRSLCRTLLCRKWFSYEGTLEKGAQCNIYLDELVKGFLKDSDFRRQREILRIVREESKHLNGKDCSLKSFPNIKKANFPLFFRGLCEILVSSLKLAVGDAKSSSNQLNVWESSCKLLNMLLEIVQNSDVPRNFQIFLKYSHLYLKVTVQDGLKVFEKHLKKNPEQVCELLKNLQITTRYLHHLCCHSKAALNTAIISQIPSLRETVENYLFRIKALLTANNCGSVFLLGNLKNKDLHGDELLSQTASLGTTASTAQNSDEEIPDDDTSIDETIAGDGDNMDISHDNGTGRRSKCF
uniref:Fanconi anemia group D2 protein n=1 Tax=Glossina morsitans morsitans TaxID=37546 RepID=A0A1B0FNR3_GLOMM